ncbi:MAG: hypothetical protein JWM32_1657 [Verrucomicrobia bacterium]|nr:hypothetical protein [Verrucomicrobiota bacterium]
MQPSETKRGETEAHRTLKRLAMAWARAHSLPLAAQEVRIPRSAYRADVAGASRHPARAEGVVAVFECKQCRADFLHDEADETTVKAAAASHHARLLHLRQLVALHRPDLRRGESLFAEYDSYDLRDLRHDTLHGLEKELVTLQRKIVSCVKFSKLCRYQAAEFFYLVTEAGIAEPHEVPHGWGWLVREGDVLELKQLPVRHTTSTEHRITWLENIAAAGARTK